MSWQQLKQLNAVERQMEAGKREMAAIRLSMNGGTEEEDDGSWTRVQVKPWGAKGYGKQGQGGKAKGKGKSGGVSGSWGKGAGNDWSKAEQPKGAKGKGQTKGKGAQQKEDWPCWNPDCKCPAGKLNWGKNVNCNWCGLCKNAAMNPPRGGWKAAAEEPAEAEAAVAGEADSAMGVAVVAAPPSTLKPDEVDMLRALGLSIIRPRDKAKVIFAKQPAWDLKKTADEEVAGLCKTSDLLAAAQASVCFCQNRVEKVHQEVAEATTDADKKGLQQMLDHVKSRLKEEEKSVTELGKKNSSGEAQLHELQSKKNLADKKESERVQKATAASTAAQERFLRLEAVMVAQSEAVTARLEALREEFREISTAALERAADYAKFHVERTAAWEERIAIADKAAGGGGCHPVEPANLAEAKTRIEQAKAALKEAEDQALLLQLNVGGTDSPLAKLERQKADLELTFDAAQPSDLPKPAESDWIKDNLDELQGLWGFYGLYGMCSPPAMTYDGAGATVEVCKILVGPKLWKGFYGDREDSIQQEDVVPRQLHIILRQVLMKSDQEFKKSQELEKASRERWELNRTAALDRHLGGKSSNY